MTALHNRRSPAQQQKYLSLFNSHSHEAGVLSGISVTNRHRLSLGDGDASRYAGVYPTISLANHRYAGSSICYYIPHLTGYTSSCGPTAIWTWNGDTFSSELRALRRLEPGEELTVTYVNPCAPRDVRREALQVYHFTCECPWCGLSPEESLTSDKNRHEIHTWTDNHLYFIPWLETPQSTNESYFADGEMVIELCKKEGLEFEIGWFARDMMLGYSLMADTLNCRRYARLMFGVAKAGTLPDKRNLGIATEYLENPRKAAGRQWGNRLAKGPGDT
jgi:hypothetical protein